METNALSCKLLVCSDFVANEIGRVPLSAFVYHILKHIYILQLLIAFYAFHRHGISKRFIIPIFTILLFLLKSAMECRIAHIQFYEYFVLTDINNTSLWKPWCLCKSVYYLIRPFGNRRSRPSVCFY